jgi:hypothetical protein
MNNIQRNIIINHPLSKASVYHEMAVPTNDNIKKVHGRQTNASV